MEVLYDLDGSPFVMWGENRIQLESGPVTDPVILEKAEKDLRETPEMVKQALVELRNMLKGLPSLYIPVDDDDFLMKFLRPCKFYAESAFKRIQTYYKYKQTHAEYCNDLVPSSTRAAFVQSIFSISPLRDQHGRRILHLKPDKWDTREVRLTDAFRSAQMALEVLFSEPVTQICGLTLICDVRGLTFSHIMQFSPSFSRCFIDWIQNCFPMRLKAVHIVNQSYMFNILFTILKPFITEKLRTRIFFHGSNLQSLLNYVEEKALMQRLGGSLPEPEVSGELLWELLSNYENELLVRNTYGFKDKK